MTADLDALARHDYQGYCRGCRCDICRAAKQEVAIRYRRKKGMKPRELDLLARVLAKVEDVEGGCTRINVAPGRLGYRYLSINGKMRLAHRVTYELFVGPVPAGLSLDHLCRNPWCVQPAHLEPVDHRTNVLRGISPAARNAVKTHCKHGHEFTADNTTVNKRGGRVCKTCVRERHRTRRALGRAA